MTDPKEDSGSIKTRILQLRSYMTDPKEEDSVLPGASPSSSPSSLPTVVRSSSPCSAPSGSPSAGPSASPSGGPSASPSAAPSAAPSVLTSAGPIGSPSAVPTVSPSGTSSAYPSAEPSGAPSAALSPSSSDIPSGSSSSTPLQSTPLRSTPSSAYRLVHAAVCSEIIRPTSYGIVHKCWFCTVAGHRLVIWDTMLYTFHMLFAVAMTGTLLPDVNISVESSTVAQRVAESIHRRSFDSIIDHNLASRID
jgi:hypothetical protein